ncbi:hypothetical protein GGS23DRAFT_447954 [Durotheca rogersii]|uniref:uncharacterized protein n=1 Tax=Durotheca rogersii TaxID=419775 RepID=UPI00221E7BE6|nr:uncharacterized protein GGS23DRAFT_447954 [Durotheca rogersii]KAI5864463.1 hypothetical protein GGS23DRAFT_447954 [Durotheca rogersii]
MPPSTSISLSHQLSTILILSLLLLAFFPEAFHYLLTFPLAYIYRHLTQRSELERHPAGLDFGTAAAAATAANLLTPAPAPAPVAAMSWFQTQFTLPERSRGSYLITDHVLAAVPEIRLYRVGLLHLFIQHTSCALSLNENYDSDVRADMSDALDRIAPEAGPRGQSLYRHSAEGSDDMPAHVKSALIGASVTIPITDGQLATGTWQGIWYLEFRRVKHTRKVVATIQGEK